MSNRQIRRLQEAEERRRKKEQGGQSTVERRAAAMQTRPPEASERKTLFKRLKDYLHEVRVEMKKVTWPNREQMVAFTTVTVITSVILTAVIFGFDVVAKDAILRLVEMSR
jgi:preprotein translocase subunit SecE